MNGVASAGAKRRRHVFLSASRTQLARYLREREGGGGRGGRFEQTLHIYVERYFVARSRNICSHRNVTHRSLFIVVADVSVTYIWKCLLLPWKCGSAGNFAKYFVLSLTVVSINRLKPTGCVMHQQVLTFNSCTLCPHCIYVFCIYLRTNSDLCHLQHKLIGFYNRDEKCLLLGTYWVFK